jgi:hypothetical protein
MASWFFIENPNAMSLSRADHERSECEAAGTRAPLRADAEARRDGGPGKGVAISYSMRLPAAGMAGSSTRQGLCDCRIQHSL